LEYLYCTVSVHIILAPERRVGAEVSSGVQGDDLDNVDVYKRYDWIHQYSWELFHHG
jgi:hypothetical protein